MELQLLVLLKAVSTVYAYDKIKRSKRLDGISVENIPPMSHCQGSNGNMAKKKRYRLSIMSSSHSFGQYHWYVHRLEKKGKKENRNRILSYLLDDTGNQNKLPKKRIISKRQVSRTIGKGNNPLVAHSPTTTYDMSQYNTVTKWNAKLKIHKVS